MTPALNYPLAKIGVLVFLHWVGRFLVSLAIPLCVLVLLVFAGLWSIVFYRAFPFLCWLGWGWLIPLLVVGVRDIMLMYERNRLTFI